MQASKKPFLVVVVESTALGKTELSIELIKKVNGEVISGDSMRVYRQMNIGTVKVTEIEVGGVPHYLIDILSPDESFSIYEFKKRAEVLTEDITERGKVLIIAGGTGLYIQSLIYDYPFDDENISVEKELRVKEKIDVLNQLNNDSLHRYLASFGETSAKDIHPSNGKRVLRAIEYYSKTKKLLSSRKKVQQFIKNYDTLLIGIGMSRKTLYTKVNKRVDIMLGHRLFNEVKAPVKQSFESSQSMQAIGYKELVPVIKREMELEPTIKLLEQYSKRCAKRRLTWFKDKMDVQWSGRETMSLQMMSDEITTRINKRSSKYDCKPEHPRSGTREF